MRRWVAVSWHASFSAVAAVLYFFFVLPRFPELTGSITHTVGTVMRIVTALFIGLAALPVLFTLLRTRRPELGTPQLALTLRITSIVLHVLAAVLILVTAITEIWVSVDTAGQWLFGVYGAAAAVALLGMAAFWLAFVAEKPPPPPKPLKSREPRERTRRRGRGDKALADDETASDDDVVEIEEPKDGEVLEDDANDDAEVSPPEPEPTADEPVPSVSSASEEPALDPEAGGESDESDDVDESGKLRNRRPSGKVTPGRRRRRLRGGVAVED
jgi:hypothetical protein